MQNKLKNIFILTLVVILFLGVFGCGRKDPMPDPNPNLKKGSIVISIPLDDKEEQVMQSVVDAYQVKNPLVNVNIDAKSGADYKDLLSQTLTATDMNAVNMDIVRNNEVSQYYGSNKFVDYSQYLDEPNQYYNDLIWRDTMENSAYKPNGANGQVYSINFETTQVFLYYNKNILSEAGIKAAELLTWNDLISACNKILALGKDYVPMAISGDRLSFWSGQMSWLFRVYVDQYFKSIIRDVHTQDGDWNFDPLVDANWHYKPNFSDYPELSADEAKQAAWNNDDYGYSQNELRLLSGIMNDQWGQNDPKYLDMLTNLQEMFPKHCGVGFGTDTQDTAMLPFWNGKGGFTIMTTNLINDWQKREITNFELGTMDFVPMTDNAVQPGGAPDVEYTRSIGGAHGFYGIINKNAKQTELCLDFMKFWTSKAGQEAAIAKRVELDFLLTGTPLVKGVVIPDSINVFADRVLRGVADNNPATYFARGLGNEGNSTREFQENALQLFTGKITVQQYGANMSDALKRFMPNYLESRGFRANSLDDITKFPF